MGLEELERARKKFPIWPIDPIHASSFVVEEAGELAAAANELVYPDLAKGNPDSEELQRRVLREAIQTLAMSIRFIQNWPYDEIIFTERKED